VAEYLTTPDTPFARRPYEELDAENQELWRMVKRRTGQATHVEVMAAHPVLDKFYSKEFYPRFYYNSEGEMLVPWQDKELFRLRLSRRNGCALCNAGNVETMLEAGYSQDQVDNILQPSSAHYSDKELALIDFADLFVQGEQGVLSRELHARLRQHYSDAAILEIGVVGAFFMGWQRMLFAFDLTPHEENGVCSIAA
jgi:alkylhydroperoxidase family enzyme